MLIDVYTIVRNEEYMMPFFMRHYLRFAYNIYIYDDHSDDNTLNYLQGVIDGIKSNENHDRPVEIIIKTLPFQGLDDIAFVEYLHDEYRKISTPKFGNIWVMMPDVDEFLMFDRYKMRDGEIQGKKLFFSEGYQMLSETPPQGNGQIYDYVKMGIRDNQYDKPILFKADQDINLAYGRHNFTSPNPVEVGHGIKLLHYRYLGEEYIRQRHSRNSSMINQRNRVLLHGSHTYPENIAGKYSIEWYKNALKEAKPCLD